MSTQTGPEQRGSAGRLVVEPGDRVSAVGRVVRLDGVDWLDLAQVDDLVGRSRPWKSDRSVRLAGFDVAATAPMTARQEHITNQARVVGVWHDEVIEVETQEPVDRPADEYVPMLALPAPGGGWDASIQTTTLTGMKALRDDGLVVRDSWLRERGGALLLRVAAADVTAVEAVLAPQLPRRLCLVHSRYSAGDLREVTEALHAHHARGGSRSGRPRASTRTASPSPTPG